MAASAISFLLLAYGLSSFSPVLAQIVISKNLSTYNVAFETPVNTLATIGTTTVSTTLPQSLNSSQEPDLRNSTFSTESSNNTRLEVISTTPTSKESNPNDTSRLEISTSTTGNNASKRNESYSITDTIYPATPEGSSGFVTQTPSSERTTKILDNRTTQGSETTTIVPKGWKDEPPFKRQNISELLSLSSSSTATNSVTSAISRESTTLLGLLLDKNQNISEPADAIANGTSNTTPLSVTNIAGDQHLIMSQRLYELCQSPPKSVKCFGDKRNCFKTSNCTFLGVVQESNSHINVSLVTQVYDATKDSINVTILLRRGSKANSSDFQCDRVSFKSIQINIQPRRKNQTIIPETRCSAAMIDKRELQSDCEQAIGRSSTFQPKETLGIKFTVSDKDATKLIPLGFQHVGPKEPQVRQGRKMNLTSALPHESDKLSIYTTCSQNNVACFSDKPQCTVEGRCDYLLSVEQNLETFKIRLLSTTPTSLSQLYMEYLIPFSHNNTAPAHYFKQECDHLPQEFLIQPYIELGNTENRTNSMHPGPYTETTVLTKTKFCSGSENITVSESPVLNGTSPTSIKIIFKENQTNTFIDDDVHRIDGKTNSTNTIVNRLRLYSVEPKVLSLTSAGILQIYNVLTLLSMMVLVISPIV